MNFSKKLRELLNKENISIKDFANKIGMSEIGLHNAIKNNSTKLVTLNKIAKELRVKPTIFLSDSLEVENKPDLNLLKKQWIETSDYIKTKNVNVEGIWNFFEPHLHLNDNRMLNVLKQCEIYFEQENMNDNYNGVWRDTEEKILSDIKELLSK